MTNELPPQSQMLMQPGPPTERMEQPLLHPEAQDPNAANIFRFEDHDALAAAMEAQDNRAAKQDLARIAIGDKVIANTFMPGRGNTTIEAKLSGYAPVPGSPGVEGAPIFTKWVEPSSPKDHESALAFEPSTERIEAPQRPFQPQASPAPERRTPAPRPTRRQAEIVEEPDLFTGFGSKPQKGEEQKGNIVSRPDVPEAINTEDHDFNPGAGNRNLNPWGSAPQSVRNNASRPRPPRQSPGKHSWQREVDGYE